MVLSASRARWRAVTSATTATASGSLATPAVPGVIRLSVTCRARSRSASRTSNSAVPSSRRLSHAERSDSCSWQRSAAQRLCNRRCRSRPSTSAIEPRFQRSQTRFTRSRCPLASSRQIRSGRASTVPSHSSLARAIAARTPGAFAVPTAVSAVASPALSPFIGLFPVEADRCSRSLTPGNAPDNRRRSQTASPCGRSHTRYQSLLVPDPYSFLSGRRWSRCRRIGAAERLAEAVNAPQECAQRHQV